QKYFLKALNQDDSFLEARYNLGVTQGKLGKFKAAEEVFRQPIRACNDFLIARPRERRLEDAGYEDAEGIERAHRQEWKDFLVNLRLTRQFEEHEKYLKQIASADKDMRKAWSDFGLDVYEQAKYPEAAKIFKKTISLVGKYIRLLEGLGLENLDDNDYPQAVKTYLSLFDLVGSFKEASIMLGTSL
ncbi:MAG: tetratricopeptide repeat protein, partial [Actinomycetota bacterium]